MSARDAVWAHPDLLPSSEDLDKPSGFIDGVIGGGANVFDDPLAQLAETEARERREGAAAQQERPNKDADGDKDTDGTAAQGDSASGANPSDADDERGDNEDR
jgi:hypothetical protein